MEDWKLLGYESLEQWQGHTERLIPLVYHLVSSFEDRRCADDQAVAALPPSITPYTLKEIHPTVRAILDNVCTYLPWKAGWKGQRPPPFSMSICRPSMPKFPLFIGPDHLVPLTAPVFDGTSTSFREPLRVVKEIRAVPVSIDDVPATRLDLGLIPQHPAEPIQKRSLKFGTAYSTLGVTGSGKKRPALSSRVTRIHKPREWEAEESLRVKMYKLRVRAD